MGRLKGTLDHLYHSRGRRVRVAFYFFLLRSSLLNLLTPFTLSLFPAIFCPFFPDKNFNAGFSCRPHATLSRARVTVWLRPFLPAKRAKLIDVVGINYAGYAGEWAPLREVISQAETLRPFDVVKRTYNAVKGATAYRTSVIYATDLNRALSAPRSNEFHVLPGNRPRRSLVAWLSPAQRFIESLCR